MKWLALVLCLLANAQGRQSAKDWPAHISFEQADMGVEYLVHSVLWQGDSLFLKDYLVVEVAFYPAKKREPFLLKQEDFALRVNGKQQTLIPQWPTQVADAYLRQYDTAIGPVMGRQTPLPAPPRVPEPEDRSGVRREKLTPEEILTKASLYEGKLNEPVRGLLYFAYKAKPGSIKKVELLYRGGKGEVTIPLL